MRISPGVFFIFSKFWFFGLLGGRRGGGGGSVKVQKAVQNDKKFCPLHSIFEEPYDKKLCLSCSISQEPYIIGLSFMVQMCKMIMLKLWFSRLSRGWRGKKWPKMLKISFCRTLYFRNHISYDLHFWYTCMYKRIISRDIFFIFFRNFDIWYH